MTTHENAPPPEDWMPQPHCCARRECWYCQQEQPAIPPNVILGAE